MVGEQNSSDFHSAQLYGIPLGRDCSKWNSSLQADFDSIRPVEILRPVTARDSSEWIMVRDSALILDVKRECAASRF
jgi:hypothetical protein